MNVRVSERGVLFDGWIIQLLINKCESDSEGVLFDGWMTCVVLIDECESVRERRSV